MKTTRMTAVVAAAVAVVAPMAGRASAATLSTYNWNSAGAGTVTTVPFGNDADGSYQLQTTGNADKAALIFGNATATGLTALGRLGDLSAVMADAYRSSASTAGASNTFAYRIILNPYDTAALVWENNYNGNAAVPTDYWQSLDLTGGNYWQRGGGKNFNGGQQAVPLATWDTGTVVYTTDGNGAAAVNPTITADSPVYGLEVAYGSGAGAYLGNVDHVGLTFGTGASAVTYTANAAVPEPTALGLIGVVGTALAARRRARR